MPMLRQSALWVLLALSSQAMALNFTSHSTAPAVVELFTSEGCSSCPPAERWLNRFTQHPGLWDQVFPIAWHVDYWDSIGWPDRFAKSRHSARQWRYKKQTPLRSVYTPGVLVNGEAWRGWRIDQTPGKPGGSVPGILHIELDRQSVRGELSITTNSETKIHKSQDLLLHAAILGTGLSTEVRRGENAGKQLQHDFVVLADVLIGNQDGAWVGSLPDLPQLAGESQRLAAVFWLERANSPVPVVITGGWLPDTWYASRETP